MGSCFAAHRMSGCRSLRWRGYLHYGALAFVLFLGLLVRTHELGDRSLWLDEAFTWRLTQFPLGEMLDRIGRDNSPPLHFVLLKAWSAIFGSTPVALRSLSVLCGGLGVLGAYLVSREAFLTPTPATLLEETRERGKGIGLVAAAFVALSVLQLRYSQEVRMYALAVALALCSSWALLRALKIPSRLSRWLLYGSLALLLIYTHYYGLFTLAAQAAFAIGFLLVRENWSLAACVRCPMFRPALLTAALVVAGWLPWLPVFLHQRAQVQKAYWTQAVKPWDLAPLSYQLLVNPEPTSFPLSSLQLFCADLCAIVMLLLRRKAREGEWFVLCGVLVPLLLAWMVSAWDTKVFGAPRFFVMMQPFLFIGFAAILWRLPPPMRTLATTGLLAGALWLCVDFWDTTDVANRPGFRGAAQLISEHRKADEPIVTASPLIFFSMLYHAENRHEIYVCPGDKPMAHYYGIAALTPNETLTADQLRNLPSPRVWVVEIAGGFWESFRVPVPSDWVAKSRSSFPEVFGLGTVSVVEYETRQRRVLPEP